MYKVTINGIEIACDDPREALELAQLAAAGTPPRRRGPGRPPLHERPARELRAEKERKSTLAFIRLLESCGPRGAPNSDIVKAMELRGPRGVGGALITVKRILEKQGFSPRDAFTMKGEGKNRRWKAGPRIAEAAAKLEGLGADR